MTADVCCHITVESLTIRTIRQNPFHYRKNKWWFVKKNVKPMYTWTGKWCTCCIWHHHCVVYHGNYPGCCFGKSQRFRPQGGSTAHYPKVRYALSGTAIMALWHVIILWNTPFLCSSNFNTCVINGRGGRDMDMASA